MKGLNNMSSQSELGSLITLANIFSRLPWETAAEISQKILLPREEKKLNWVFVKKKKTKDLINLNSTYQIINLIMENLTNKFFKKTFYIKQKRFLFLSYRTKLFTRCSNIEKGEILHEETIHSKSFIFEEINYEKTFQFLIRYE